MSTAPATQLAPTSDLLERTRQLEALEAMLDAVRTTSRGRLVLVAGEAGAGKTALVRRFVEGHATERALWSACDALFTPRALGPLLDVAHVTGGELAEVTAGDAGPHDVANALLRELGRRAPTILVVEDLHWADEATLDVLRLLGRRADAAPALVLATYRDDELDLRHPLRVVLGELATAPDIARCHVDRLSSEAVAQLAEPHGLDPDELHRRTAGNPFFLSEVIASGDHEIPPTVRDAVLARAARLSPKAAALLGAVAVSQPQAELWLLEALAAEDELACLGECLSAGMLTPTADGVAFRHELARMTIEETTAPHRATRLHRDALAALTEPPAGAPDPARLAHHADAAGDAPAVLRYAPAAAARAEAVGAHRQAAAQYARALRFGAGLAPEERVVLLEGRYRSAFRADDCGEAIEAMQDALTCHRALGDRLSEGDRMRRLSDVLFCPGDRSRDADDLGRQAVTVLEGLEGGRELGLAYANMASLCMNREDAEGTAAWAARALALADRLGDVAIRIHALNTVGTMELLTGDRAGEEKLELSIALARDNALEEDAARGYGNLAWATLRSRLYPTLDAGLAAGLEHCTEPQLDLWRLYLQGFQSRSLLDQGRWTEAAETAKVALGDARTSSIPRILAGVTLGLVRARRGDPRSADALDAAQALAEVSEELQRIEAIAAARAEVAWLRGDRQGAVQATEAAHALATELGAGGVVGELALWRRRAGLAEELTIAVPEPYASQLRGDWRAAAERWAAIGRPYDEALALAEGDAEGRHAALDRLHGLGAAPAAAIVARRLRARGARGLRRGPRRSTRDNPANLTPREVEVLGLVEQGLRNKDIADRLFVSAKTVDHHVGAILRKLGVHTRGEAGAAARRLGIVAGED